MRSSAVFRHLRSVSRPKQARSESTLRRLLDTAQTMIEEGGHQDLSITEVARRAGSSIGGFYARFRSKDELLRALEERHFEELRALLDALAAPDTWRDASPHEIVRGLLRVLIERYQRHRRLLVAFMARAVAEPERHQEAIGFRHRVGERLAALAVARGDLVGHPDPRLAAQFAVQAVFGILQTRLVSGALGGPSEPLDDDTLARELERLVLAYLGIPLEQSRGAHP
jgi:AcrR family transcriptional regulator